MALTKISTAMISQSAAAVDLNVDAGTFYVDTTNNRVGVGGKTDPDTPLHVIGTVTATPVRRFGRIAYKYSKFSTYKLKYYN